MRLVIDAQILQTDDFYRGMGFYLSAILEALPQVSSTDQQLELTAILNSHLARVDESSQLIKKWFPSARIMALDLQAKTSHEQTFSHVADANRQAVTTALKEQMGTTPFVYFIPAQFAYDIFPVFPDMPGTCKVVLFHDLIPYLYAKEYFDSFIIKPCIDYCERFKEIFAADRIVTNSQTTADDLMIHFGFDEQRVQAIFGSGAPRTGIEPARPDIAELTETTRFVMMPSGDDRRKNNRRAVEAFAQAVKEAGQSVKLVVTSRFSEGSQQELSTISPDVIFAGKVSDAEFLWLTDHAECLFFPTEYEGLGMPILEGVARDAKIICSAIPVFEEIDNQAFLFCDPLSVADIKRALVDTLQAKVGWKDKIERYPAIRERFSWPKTAQLFLEAVQGGLKHHAPRTKKKLAVHAPSPDSYSAVGKYALETHAELSRYYDIDYYLDSGHTVFDPVRLNILQHVTTTKPAVDFNPETPYDAVLYHMGASEFGINTMYHALCRPGVAIMHDCFFGGMYDYMLRHGYITQERYDAESRLAKAFSNQEGFGIAGIVNSQEGLVCHSEYARQVITKSLLNKVPITRLEHPGQAPRIMTPPRATGKVVVSFAGILSPDKGIDLVRSIATLDPRVEVRLFGFGVLGHTVDVSDLPNVTLLTDLSDLAFQNALRTSDILVNYRLRYFGETSRTTIEAMRFGVPVVVRNIGWYAEQPNDAVVKVDDIADLTSAVKELVGNDERRLQVSRRAYEYAKQAYAIGPYIEQLRQALEGEA
jgi:glycosyltransferase involved in cell wall biosynthesis